MIRVVPLNAYDEALLGKFCQILYTAFGVGTQLVTDRTLPSDAKDIVDAVSLLAAAPQVPAYKDDKILFLTEHRIQDIKLNKLNIPAPGYALFGKDKAIISTFQVKDFEAALKQVGRLAMHHVGHLWELHHCLDPRCAMYPTWTPSFASGDASFCNYCREKSEDKIRLAQS